MLNDVDVCNSVTQIHTILVGGDVVNKCITRILYAFITPAIHALSF